MAFQLAAMIVCLAATLLGLPSYRLKEGVRFRASCACACVRDGTLLKA